VVQISAGADHTLALKADGTVFAWGYNGYGQTTIPQGLTNVKSVAAGGEASMALKSDGTVLCWGDNTYGQSTPPSGLNSVVQLAGGGFHSVALKNDGTVICWGDNTYGQCNVPKNLTNVIQISAGWDHTIALKNDGTVVCWGLNTYGQSTNPAALKYGLSVSGGNNHSVCIINATFGGIQLPNTPRTFPLVNTNASGILYGWGNNANNQTAIPYNITNAIAVYSANQDYTTVLLSGGTVTSFGNMNINGVTWSASSFNNIFDVSGSLHPTFLGNDGSIKYSGSYYDSYYGRNYILYGSYGAGFVGISGSFLLDANGGVFNINITDPSGSYGWWTTPNSISGISVQSFSGIPIYKGVVAISSSYNDLFALLNNGQVLGSGTDAAAQVPPCLAGIVQVAAGNGFAAALRSDGTVYVWGDNTYGQCNVPIGLNHVIKIATGNHHLIALRSDGTIVAWGDNTYGQTTIPAGINSVVYVAAGDGNTFIIQSPRSSPNFLATLPYTPLQSGSPTNGVVVDDPIGDWLIGTFTNSLFQNLTTAMAVNTGFLNAVATNSSFVSALARTITNSPATYGVLQQGPQGSQGLAGPQGPIGLTGPQGLQGAQGPKGDKGDTGAQGPMGLTGPQGPAGVNGANGAQGPVGPQGAQGPAGPQGATGTFDPTVLTNTAFLNGLATNQAFISAMTTNPAFLAAIAQGIAGSTNNYGFYLKQSQNLNFPAIAPITFSYGKTVKLTVTSSAGLTPVVFSSANPGVASVSNNVLTVIGAGTTTVTASQAGNLSTAPVSVSQNFVVTPVLQTLKFSSIAPQTYASGKTLTLSVTSSAKLSPITFTSSNEGVAIVSNNVLTLVGRGTSVITANQAGDGNNTSASAVQILTVN
jgi:alpha-tubulin suppressor-like RCC1 family protein